MWILVVVLLALHTCEMVWLPMAWQYGQRTNSDSMFAFGSFCCTFPKLRLLFVAVTAFLVPFFGSYNVRARIWNGKEKLNWGNLLRRWKQ
jgi:hypothetical protein